MRESTTSAPARPARSEGATEKALARREQYELEKELATRIRSAPPDRRPALYADTYDELFRRLEQHPQCSRGAPEARVRAQLRLIEPHIAPRDTFLEIGAGDGSLALAVSRLVGKAYALEVSREIATAFEEDSRVELLFSSGVEIPLPTASVDFAYSYQVVEHLHPDDAMAHFREVARVLAPGGSYLCITPNRLSGPHDISRGFDREASGLHLREYTLGEICARMKAAGFAKPHAERLLRGRVVALPPAPVVLAERCLGALPYAARSRIARRDWVDRALDIYALARKPAQ